jgi:phage protein D
MSNTWVPAPGALRRRTSGIAMPSAQIPDLSIRVNGAQLPRQARADVRAVTVEEDLDALSMFSLELHNWDEEMQAVSWSDSSLFALGGQVEIWLGYVDDLQKVMTAEITGLEPAFTADQPPALTVRGYDYRHRLARDRKTRSFSMMKDSSIAAQVAREAGLVAQVKATPQNQVFVVQSNQTDWEFLRQRAGLLGFEVYVRDKTLYFQPPGYTAQPSARLALGEDITEFTPRLSSLGQETQVTVRSWDLKQKQAITGTARIGEESAMAGKSGPAAARRAYGQASTSIVDQPARTKADADQIALGRFNELALAYVRGTVAGSGRPQLHAGMVVHIDGAGQAFSGPYYVTSIVHAVSQEEGYRTSFTVERNAT